MSRRYLFPDNTVLCNFASVRRLDLLETIFRESGRWTSSVAAEAVASARHLPGLQALPWMGEPMEITDDVDISAINRIRRVVFGGTDDRPLQHLGEAETCFVLQNWPEFAGSWWVSDDREALRYARRQGIPTFETLDLMAGAVADGDVTDQVAFDLMRRMTGEGRHLRLPADRHAFRR